MPSTNGILLSAGSSVSYFFFSLVSLLACLCHYQTVEFGIRSVLLYSRVCTLLYGVLLMGLGLITFVVELSGLAGAVETSWAGMSQYQRDFFDNDISRLEAVRQTNTSLVGLFAIIVGILFAIIGCFSFKLCSLIGEKLHVDKSSASRLPVMDPPLQQVRFKNANAWFTANKENDQHYKYLRSYIEVKQR